MSDVQQPETQEELNSECLADPCLNVNCGTCLASPCAVCDHPYGDHYTTNNGKWSGCEDSDSEGLACLCEGFSIPEHPEEAICITLPNSGN